MPTNTNKVKFGLSNVYIAARTVNEQGVVSYSTPVALKGAVSLIVSKPLNKSTFRADNSDYYKKYITSAREATLEIAELPDWFKVGYLGYKQASDGYLAETNLTGGEFAIGYQVETDKDNNKYVSYNCIAAENDDSNETTQENDLGIKPRSLALTISGEDIDGVMCYNKQVADYTTSITVPTWATSN